MTIGDAWPEPKFEVRCRAGDIAHLQAGTDSVSVTVGQRIHRKGREEIWESIKVSAEELEDGSLAVRVVVFHPDWDEPLRIASIESLPTGRNAPEPALRCDFEQRQL